MTAGMIAVIGVMGVPSICAAHLVSTGMGPVYDGIGHLLLSPEDLIPVVAMALYAGLRGIVIGRRTMFLLPPAWFAGGVAGLLSGHAVLFPFPALSFLILGGLIAADLFVPSAAVAAITVALGIIHGFLNGAVLRDGAGTLGLLGIVAIVFVLATIISALIVSLKRPWMRIAVRVAGSWIAATGLLMIGWTLR
jgi:hydrogenase/urease accessory protein HupE